MSWGRLHGTNVPLPVLKKGIFSRETPIPVKRSTKVKHDANIIVQPNIEIRVFSQGVEVALVGVFFGQGDEVDVGMGIADGIKPELVANALSYAAEALLSDTSWYDRSGLEEFPEIAEQIKNGTIS
jgi:hypothetical protein